MQCCFPHGWSRGKQMSAGPNLARNWSCIQALARCYKVTLTSTGSSRLLSWQRILRSDLQDLLRKELHQADSWVLWEHYAPWFKWVLQLPYTKSVRDVHRCNLSTGSSLIHAMRSLFRPDLPTDAQLKVKWVTLAIEAVWAPVGTWQECSLGWVLGSDSAHGRGHREHLDVATPSIISCIYM